MRLRAGCVGDVLRWAGGGSGCWRVVRTDVCGRIETATRPGHRHADAESGPLLHAFENEVDAVSFVLRHSTLPGKDMVFLAHALLGPNDRGMMIAGEGFHPVLVVGGALAQDFLAHHRNA